MNLTNQMPVEPIVIKFNNDLEFRKDVAAKKVYHGRNMKRQMTIELALLVVAVAGAVALWVSKTDIKNSTYIMYAFMIVAAVFLARFLRAMLNRSRIKPADEKRAEREYVFQDDGFMFGPVNESGELIKTRWGDIDRVYVTDGVVYFLCMSRKHWAAVDRRLLVCGEWDALIALVKARVPRFKIYGLSFKE